MTNELTKVDQDFKLIDADINKILGNIANHDEMIGIITTNLPEIQKVSSSFYKSQSQFMDNILTVSHPTPLRNIRQIMAEIDRSKAALQEAYFNNKKRVIEIKILDRDIGKCEDDLKKELLLVEHDQKMFELEQSKSYISGAIRKVTNLIMQYKSIMKELKISSFDELDFEKEEEQYHIKKAFDQAIISARPRGGIVDEGNQIYFSQIGINGGAAQIEIVKFLQKEAELATNGKADFKLITDFLDDMYNKFKGCSLGVLKHKKMIEMSEVAMIIHKKPVEDNNLPIEDKKPIEGSGFDFKT